MGLTYSSVVDAALDDVFSWHTRPGAITRLTPPWQPVRVLREAGSLRDGEAVLGLPGGLRCGRRPPAGRLRPAERVRRRPGLPPAAVAAHPPVQPGGGGGHAGDRRGRHPAARPGAAVDARLPAPAARRRPGRDGPGPRDLPRPADGGRHRFRRPHRHRADRAADHQRAPGHPAGPPHAPARGRASLAAGGPGPRAARRGRRGDPPGRRLDRRPVHSRAQGRDPRQPDPAHPPPGPAGRGQGHRRQRHRLPRRAAPAGVRHGVGHRHLRPGSRSRRS